LSPHAPLQGDKGIFEDVDGKVNEISFSGRRGGIPPTDCMPLDAYARGGHEIREKPAQWAKVSLGALERIVEETGIMLKELFS